MLPWSTILLCQWTQAMYENLINRYKADWVQMRAYCHFLQAGLITAFFVTLSPWGWLTLLFPISIELVQYMTNDDYDFLGDGIYDAAEGLLGSLLIGNIFFWVLA